MKEFLGKVWNAIVFTIPILIYLGLLGFGVISVVSSCSEHNEVKHNDSYYEAYSDGYNEGYDEGYDEGLEIGYDYGHDDGIYYDWEENIDEIGWYFEEEAIDYAIENGGWHPEEAWMVIEAYQNNASFYQNGSPPTKQDYLDAINSLIYFYDYFYSERYE